MAHTGKYIDRNPCLKTAGIQNPPPDGAGDTFKSYSKEEEANDIIVAKCKYKEKLERKKLVRVYPSIPDEQLKDILSPELKKSRFVAFREKFSEDMYFKKAKLGEVQELHSKPDNINNESTTFGKVNSKSESAYGLILPNKSADEVNRDFYQWHDKYIISHKHYFPSERVNRHYDNHFDPKSIFGINTHVDMTGKFVRAVLNQPDKLLLISKAQKHFLEKSSGRLGKSVNRNYDLPEDMTFGEQSCPDSCDAQALLENLNPCPKKNLLVGALAHIHNIRRSLHQRIDFHVHDFNTTLEMADKERTGYLPLEKIYEIARHLQLYFDYGKIQRIVRHFKLVKDEGLSTEIVDYNKFCQLLQVHLPLPHTGSLSPMPNHVYNKETTYRLLCNDREKVPNDMIIYKQKKKDDEVTASMLISPDITMKFCLVPSDFTDKRSKETLRRIFQTVLSDKFDEIWQSAQNNLKPVDDLISVNELRAEMDKFNAKN